MYHQPRSRFCCDLLSCIFSELYTRVTHASWFSRFSDRTLKAIKCDVNVLCSFLVQIKVPWRSLTASIRLRLQLSLHKVKNKTT